MVQTKAPQQEHASIRKNHNSNSPKCKTRNLLLTGNAKTEECFTSLNHNHIFHAKQLILQHQPTIENALADSHIMHMVSKILHSFISIIPNQHQRTSNHTSQKDM